MRSIGTGTLETERLILRQYTLADAEDMYSNWASDPEVTKFLTWPTHTSPDVSKKVLEDWTAQYSDGDFYNWAIVLKATGSVIGNIAVVRLNSAAEAADVGYALGRAFWGRGIMPEALRAVIAFLFDEVGLNRVAACHDANNPNSGRVMDKAGMKYEGTLRQAGHNNQGTCDEVWHSVIKSDRA